MKKATNIKTIISDIKHNTFFCKGKKGSKTLTVYKKRCVRCGKPLYMTNGYESEIVYFCTNHDCYLFGAFQITMENYKKLV